MSHENETLPLGLAETVESPADVNTRPVGPKASLDDARGLVGGRYRIERELGRGGMASVFLARDVELDELVAVKLLHPRLVADPRAALLFRREVKLARRITHPNVARTFDLHVGGSSPFLTMEYVEGRDLAEVLGGRRVSPEDAIGYLRPILFGLEAAHEAGVVHRDLKPTNILVANDGRIVVTDFGIATTLAGGASEVVGTPAYLAPEQATGAAIDARSDLYALGVMLREMLTAELPWTGESVLATVMLRLHEDPPPMPDDVPRGLAALVSRLMARSPGERPSSAREVVAMLDAWSAGEEEAAPTVIRRASNLRMPRDTFIGRSDVLEEIDAALDACACVLLVGAGGVGKSRLAEEYAWRHLHEFEGGAVNADLTDATSLEEALRAIAAALDLAPAGDITDQIAHVLRATRMLLILDGASLVFDALAESLARWCASDVRSRMLVCSRRRSTLSGSRTIELTPLRTTEAAELLRERAAAAGAPTVPPDDASAIVEAIDCLPLAIEMAAARLRFLPADRLLTRLDDRLRVLQTRNQVGRHATMEAVLDDAWEVLGPSARRALAFASVVQGGARLDAFVGLLDSDEAARPHRQIEELWEACLVDWDRNSDRIRVPALVRAYASAKLPELGANEENNARDRHALIYAQLATTLVPRLAAGGAHQALASAEPDYDNLAAALRRCVEVGRLDDAAACLRLLWPLAQKRAQFGAIRELADVLASAAEKHPRPGAALSWARVYQADSALELTNYEEAANIASGWADADDLEARVELLLICGKAAYRMNEPDIAREVSGRAVSIATEREMPLVRVRGLVNLALVEEQFGDRHEAGQLYERARQLAEDHDFRRQAGVIELNLGVHEESRGDFPRALAHAERARDLLAGDRSAKVHVYANLGVYHRALGRLEEARAYLEEAHAESRRSGRLALTGGVLYNLGAVLNAQGLPQEALVALGEALDIVEQFENKHFIGLTHAAMGLAHSALGDVGAMRQEFAEGIATLEGGGFLLEAAKGLIRYAQSETFDSKRALEAVRRAENLMERVEAAPDFREEFRAAVQEIEARESSNSPGPMSK